MAEARQETSQLQTGRRLPGQTVFNSCCVSPSALHESLLHWSCCSAAVAGIIFSAIARGSPVYVQKCLLKCTIWLPIHTLSPAIAWAEAKEELLLPDQLRLPAFPALDSFETT